jgi:hypothetical protein
MTLDSTINVSTDGNGAFVATAVPTYGVINRSYLDVAASGGAGTLNIGANGLRSLPGIAGFTSVFQKFRPVSMGLQCEFIHNTSLDQGQVVIALLPTGDSTPSTIQQALALPNAIHYSLRDGFEAIWRPQDNASFEYQPVNSQGLALGSGSPPTYVTANLNPLLFIGLFGCDTTGATTSFDVPALSLRMTLNLEAIPTIDYGPFARTEASRSDILSFEESLNSISQLPTATPWGQWASTAWAQLGYTGVAALAAPTVTGILGQINRQVQQRNFRLPGPGMGFA